MKDRIKFYSVEDLRYIYYLDKVDEFISKSNLGEKSKDINDIIELYNITKYICNDYYFEVTSINDKKIIIEKDKKIKIIVAKYFKKLNDNILIENYNIILTIYKEDFFELINKYKVYKLISSETVLSLLNKYHVLRIILYYKDMVLYFDEILRNFMIETLVSAELLLDEYEVKATNKKRKKYFPESLTNDDKLIILDKYLNFEYCNPNYISILEVMQSSKSTIEIPAKLKLKAKNKRKEFNDTLFSGPIKNKISFEITLSDEQIEPTIKDCDMEEKTYRESYSIRWFQDNLEYATLLNNFIYIFDYFDEHMRWNLFSKTNDISVLEGTLMHSKNSYRDGLAFNLKNKLSLYQLYLYHNYLNELDLRLEDVFEWFFKEYISEEFGINGFHVTMPSKDSTLLEKCRNIMPALDTALKQFELFVEDGEINHDLLNIQSKQMVYKNIPSLNKKKYVYGLGEEFDRIAFIFFSNQCLLYYIERLGEKYETFFELITNEEVYLCDFEEYQKQGIDWLVDKKYLFIKPDEQIKIYNLLEIQIFEDLYFNDFISYWHYDSQSKKLLMNWKITE